MRVRTAVLAKATLVAASLPAGAAAKDYAIIARDIVPSGEPGAVPVPAGADSQAKMYDALTPLFNHVSDSQLLQFYKPETLGVATPGPVSSETVPRAGVTITRDGFDVPHIHGVTRDDVTWGAGWVIAEDRGLLLSQARYDSLVAAIDAPGLSALGLVSNLQSFIPGAQTVTRCPDKPARCSRPGPGAARGAARHRRVPAGHQRVLLRPRFKRASVHAH